MLERPSWQSIKLSAMKEGLQLVSLFFKEVIGGKVLANPKTINMRKMM